MSGIPVSKARLNLARIARIPTGTSRGKMENPDFDIFEFVPKAEVKRSEIIRLCNELEGRRFSDRTVRNYSTHCEQFLRWMDKYHKELNADSIKEYIYSLKKKYSTASAKLASCAIRFFITNTLNRSDLSHSIPSIRQESKLPVVLSKEEVKFLIGSCLNPIHKTILTVLYACGLRLSELLSIKMSEIDFYRKTIIIHGKGKKDRFVPIDENVVNLIKTNMGHLKPNQKLCTTMDGSRCLCGRSIASLINTCAAKAGINKRTYPHLLRHSLATHLIEDGVDIRYIQVLLGHSSILSTSHYTHIATMPINKMAQNLSFLFD